MFKCVKCGNELYFTNGTLRCPRCGHIGTIAMKAAVIERAKLWGCSYSEAAILPIDMTQLEAWTQYCMGCGRVMIIHSNARWRFIQHPIRCDECRDTVQRAGYTLWEATYVE